MTSTKNEQWLKSCYGQSFLRDEAVYLRNAIKQVSGPNVLLIGNVIDREFKLDLDFPNLVTLNACSHSTSNAESTVLADAAFLPFASNSFSTLILPHVLETNELPHQVLRECYRVLQPEGYIVLTSFNPYSLLALQNYVNYRTQFQGDYFPLHRIKDWLGLLGFDVMSSAMFQYAPLCKSPRVQCALLSMNSIGDRWLPMMGGGYMILAKKREHGTTMLSITKRQRLRFPTKQSKPALAKNGHTSSDDYYE